MAEKEYIVSLNRGVDYDAFNSEMIASTGAGDIPNRTVVVENARPLSQRNTHYMLTDEEAETLKNDSRVYGINLRPEDIDDVEIGLDAQQLGSWRKTSNSSQYDLNWGMMRGIHREDVWNQTTETTLPFNYNLTGKGVDVVIQDSGIDVGHIEFTDSNGVSRVQQIDWYTESGVAGTQSASHYQDYDGHGTHVAGTVAGRTMGWAKDARIYALKISGLEGTGDSGGISVSNCFDVIKGWHNNKPIDPETGYKRPTVVNMSWGYRTSSSATPSSGNYRGTSWTYGDAGYASSSDLYSNAGIVPAYYSGSTRRIGVRYSSVDTDIQEMIDAGIHICKSAGNSFYYIDNANGQDYNNSVVLGGVTRYYHRGASPYDDEIFMVGNIDIDYTGNLENKAGSSCCGPGTNIYAPGTQIMSASSNDSSGSNDIANQTGNRQNHLLDATQYIMKISGTSMASPNVAGLLATVLEQNPGWSPAEARKWIFANSTKDKLNNGTVGDWDNSDSVHLIGNGVNYSSGSVTTIDDRPPFTKEINVRGIKLLGHGAYDKQFAGISNSFLEKVAKTIEMMLDPTATDIDKTDQAAVINGMSDETEGDSTWGKGPVAQRIGYINGSNYDRSILSNPGTYYPGYNETAYSYRAVDYVWEYPVDDSNGTGITGFNGYTVKGQVTEVIEHVLHTICQYGLPYAYPYELNILNGQIGSPLMTAMQEAIDNNVFDVSSYSGLYTPDSQPDLDELMAGMQAASSGTSHKYVEYLNETVGGRKRGDINNDGNINIDDVMGFLSFKNGTPNAYITDTIITPLTYNGYYAAIAREYQYLLIFAMWEYITEYVSGGSLSPEWNDNSRTQAGVQTNNPLGYALYNNFIKKVISKPDKATLDAIYQADFDMTYSVTVAAGTNGFGTSNKYYITSITSDPSPTLSLREGRTYTFDQSDSTNTGHVLRFSTTANGTWGGGSEYTTGVTVNGVAGNPGASTVITVANSAPDLHYYCTSHQDMGWIATTNGGDSQYIPVENTNRIFYTPFNKKDTLSIANIKGSGTVSVKN